MENDNYLYGQDSIEMASESVTDEQDENQVIYDQSNLTQRIIEAEKRYSTSSIHTSYFSSEYFEKPALYRVLFMGSASEEDRKAVFKKLSQGYVQVLHYRQHLLQPAAATTTTSSSSEDLSLLEQPVIPFKEIKHNILLLSDEDEQDLISDIYEDIGVSMIEADFTWSSNAITYAQDPDQLLLQYAWKQCPNPRQLPTAWLEPQLTQTEFKGHMYPDRTPNGIDLCVYFYTTDKDDTRVRNDLQLLCTLRKFGIYVLPLTTTRDETIKSHFAELLTRHKVRCLDLGSNLDVGQQPSFYHPSMMDRISRLQDMECTQANLPRVATYQILAVDQFCVIKDHAIFQLLKRTRERQAIREELKEEYYSQKKQWEEHNTKQEESSSSSSSNSNSEDSQVYEYDHLVTSNTPTQQTVSRQQLQQQKKRWLVDYKQLFRAISVILLCIMSVSLLFNYYKHQWTAEFKMNRDYKFTLLTRDIRGRLAWETEVPKVWLNHQIYIPIEKVKHQPGQYHLRLNVTKLNLGSFELSVNNTRSRYDTKPMQYILINPVHPPHNTRQQDVRQQPRHQQHPQSSYKKAWDTVRFFISNNNYIFKFLLVE